MKALVVGGDSKLGGALVKCLRARGHEVVWTSRRETTIPDADVHHLDLLKPELPQLDGVHVLYLMAAITGVVPGESHPDAWRVNAEGPLMLAIQAFTRGWFTVFMSSGTVERAQHTASAKQKSYVEGPVLMMGGCVVRPLPVVQPNCFEELGNLLVDVGESRHNGVIRWGA